MSSAANDKRGKLEEEFRNRMYDAEASPSQDLWARIDHELTVRENGEYKKRAVFYRQLAAACIALLLMAVGAGAYYFNSGTSAKQPLATLTPAASPAPAATLSAPADAVDRESAMAATAKLPQAEEGMPSEAAAPVTEAPAQQYIARAGTPAASGTTVRSKEYTAAAEPSYAQAEAERSKIAQAATNPLTVTENRAPEAVNNDRPINLSRSLRQTIAALPGIEDRQANGSSPSQSAFPVARTAQKAADDFRTLNEQVMAQAKRQEEEQQAKLLAFNEEAARKNKSEEKKSQSDSRWSVGMAYAPGYFDQNISLPEQMMMGSASRYSLMPSNSTAATISSVYMNEAREEYSENTDPGFSFGFEVKTGLKLTQKLKLMTGLGFLQNTARSKSSYVIQQFWGNTFADGYESNGPSTIFVPSISANFATDSLHVAKTPEYEVNHRYRYLTVPVGLQYEGNMGQSWFWYGGAGVAANILMQTTILASSSEVKDVDYDLNEDSPFRRLQWSGRVSGGIGKRLANNMSVTVGPEFRSYFNTLLAEPENTQASQGKPYAVGLNMAVNYDFNGGKKSR